jgi:type I restriction enzyme, S subunit
LVASGWRETTVGTLCDEGVLHTQTGPFGSQLHSYDYVPKGVPVIPTEGIGRRRLLTEGIPEVTKETATRLSRHRLKAGDILFARRGVQATGFSALVTASQEGWLCGTGAILLRCTGTTIDPEFLSFLLSAEESVLWLKQHAVGAVMPNLNEGVIRQLPITLPTLAEQKAIAAVLGALDVKIELNRRMNATLEAMARALFQSWFVDFDPVRAKLDGRAPAGLDPNTAALFSANFQNSEAGHIPNGWTVQPVSEIVDCVGGGTPSTAEPKYWEGGTHHWTTPKDFSSLEAPVLLNTDRKITDAGIAKISSGLLPAGTLLLSSRAPIGYLAIAAMPVAINQGFIALKCNDRASKFFMLNWCQTNMAEIKSRATGTTFAEISKQNFRPIRVVLPPKELMSTFTVKVAALYAQITTNLCQSRTLANLRDTLLPELLSGELSVAKVAEVVHNPGRTTA